MFKISVGYQLVVQLQNFCKKNLKQSINKQIEPLNTCFCKYRIIKFYFILGFKTINIFLLSIYEYAFDFMIL